MNKTAIVIGATGLVGQELVKQLIVSEEYTHIKLFVRNTIEFNSHKIELHQVDFDQINDWENEISGDTIFCCLGTTLKKAKSKEVQFKIDHTYTMLAVKSAIKNGCKTVVVVSSLGAKLNASNFYLATKGKLEADLRKLSPSHLFIFRPSILDGNRKEKRPFEQIALKLMRFLAKFGLLHKFAPTPIKILAEQMISHSLSTKEKELTIENFR